MPPDYLDPPLCARIWQSGQCTNSVKQVTCPKCRLVLHCSEICQMIHTHRGLCAHPYLDENWKPDWFLERRAPNETTEGANDVASSYSSKPLWGSMPAIDILNTYENESRGTEHLDFNVMCAASGDLRNVVRTVCGLPDFYSGSLNLVINDNDFDIVARNAILLMTAMYLDTNDAVPAMIHLWYSARIPSAMLKMVQDKLLPLIEDFCNEIADKPDNVALRKTFSTGTARQSLRIVLTKPLWHRLKGYFTINQSLAAKTAAEIRRDAVNNPADRDQYQKDLYRYWPALRMCTEKYRKNGILLPYGTSRDDFDAWNPTFLQKLGEWPFGPDCEPHMGWSNEDIMKGELKGTGDYLGAQFYMLRDMLLAFCHRIKSYKVSFRMYCVDPGKLPARLADCGEEVRMFDRIEMADICDRSKLGSPAAIATYSPLLKPVSLNPHAVMLLLFKKAVPETYTTIAKNPRLRATLEEFDGSFRPDLSKPRLRGDYERRWHPDLLQYNTIMGMLRKFEMPFLHFTKQVKLNRNLKKAGLRLRRPNEHTITKAWPNRVTPGCSKKEIMMKLAKCPTGYERYVECVRRE